MPFCKGFLKNISETLKKAEMAAGKPPAGQPEKDALVTKVHNYHLKSRTAACIIKVFLTECGSAGRLYRRIHGYDGHGSYDNYDNFDMERTRRRVPMHGKFRKLTVHLAAGFVIAAALLEGGCSREMPGTAESTVYSDAETLFGEQTPAVLRTGLSRANYAGNETVEDWVTRCSEDETEAFDAFVLYSVYADGENATYRYLILRRESASGMIPTCRVVQHSNGNTAYYEVEITYTYSGVSAADGGELLLVTATLPSGMQPELTLLVGEEALDCRLTRTDVSLEPIL
jgi:hypothetical protein